MLTLKNLYTVKPLFKYFTHHTNIIKHKYIIIDGFTVSSYVYINQNTIKYKETEKSKSN